MSRGQVPYTESGSTGEKQVWEKLVEMQVQAEGHHGVTDSDVIVKAKKVDALTQGSL